MAFSAASISDNVLNLLSAIDEIYPEWTSLYSDDKPRAYLRAILSIGLDPERYSIAVWAVTIPATQSGQKLLRIHSRFLRHLFYFFVTPLSSIRDYSILRGEFQIILKFRIKVFYRL